MSVKTTAEERASLEILGAVDGWIYARQPDGEIARREAASLAASWRWHCTAASWPYSVPGRLIARVRDEGAMPELLGVVTKEEILA